MARTRIDYVSSGKYLGILGKQRKKISICKLPIMLLLLLVPVVLVLIPLVNKKHKKTLQEVASSVNNFDSQSQFPPKPEEIWQYIKELEKINININ